MVANTEVFLIESIDVCSSNIPYGLEKLLCDVIRLWDVLPVPMVAAQASSSGIV